METYKLFMSTISPYHVILSWAAVLALMAGLQCADRSAAADSPNIIVILVDDLGYSDLGCFGSEIATPNVDRLAANGVAFTQFYNAARCNPTRAALLTGRYPHQAGVGYSDVGIPGYRGRINRESVTLAEVLSEAGYRTLMSGKWHLGTNRGDWPIERGFARFFGLLGGAGSYWEVLPGEAYRLALDSQLWRPSKNNADFYLTDAITDYAIEFVQEATASQSPFFLYLSYTAPHWPLHARSEDITKYAGRYDRGWDDLRRSRFERQKKLGIWDDGVELPAREEGIPAWDSLSAMEQRDWARRMEVYAAMVDRMDQGVGRVLEELANHGVEKNTLAMFLSDNGGCEEDPRRDTAGSDPHAPPGPAGGFWGCGPPWANASNTPFRKYKRYIHEGGIATPLICHWPNGIESPGRMDRDSGHVIDVMATVLDVAVVEYPKEYRGHSISPHEGISLAPSLRNEPRRTHEYLYWEHTGNRGVLAGNWKLVSDRSGIWELYDLERDRTELIDLAAMKPRIVDELALRHTAWADQIGVIPWSDVERVKEKQREE